jgi:uncharacterized protein YbcV (DUF1398 family)
MFTIPEIEAAHSEVKSGADFPKYIQALKKMGVTVFETWVKDSHTDYFGQNGFKISSSPVYEDLEIAAASDKEHFVERLKIHQQGGSDYATFCADCAKTGIEKWNVCLDEMTCIYYDCQAKEILVENIPQ